MQRKDVIFITAVIAIIVLAAILMRPPPASGPLPSTVIENPDKEVLRTPEGVTYIVHPSKLVQVGPGKDGLPSLNSPTFTNVSAAEEWLSDSSLVLAVENKGEARAYPLAILAYHSIVNDRIGGEPFLITYDPLSGVSVAYDGIVNGWGATFGYSGYAYNSNLVLYDTATQTYWTQLDGKAVVGPLTGASLTSFPSDTPTFGVWKDAHPDGKVLSIATGHSRRYDVDPNPGYLDTDELWFPVERLDSRLPPKTPIVGIKTGDAYKAYTNLHGTIFDRVGNTTVKITTDYAGSITFIDQTTGTRIPSTRAYWFVWAAFHPETGLYSKNST